MRKSSIILGILACLWTGIAGAEDFSLVTEDFPPFSFDENGRAAGPMSEAARALCEVADKSCSIEVLPWRRALARVENGEANGIFSLVRSPERDALFLMTRPIVRTAYSFIVRADSAWTYGSAQDVADRAIAVYGPSGTSGVAQKLVQEANAGEVLIELSNEAVLRKLSMGRYGENFVGLMNRDVARNLIETLRIGGLKFAGDVAAIDYSIALSRKSSNEADLAAFNAAIGKLAASGQLLAILARGGLEQAPGAGQPLSH